jgi:DNA-binding XRE family transcriptional regulator
MTRVSAADVVSLARAARVRSTPEEIEARRQARRERPPGVRVAPPASDGKPVRLSGRDVAKIRGALGLTQAELAPLLGVRRDSLSRIEAGAPASSTLAILLGVYARHGTKL